MRTLDTSTCFRYPLHDVIGYCRRVAVTTQEAELPMRFVGFRWQVGK